MYLDANNLYGYGCLSSSNKWIQMDRSKNFDTAAVAP